VQKRIKIRKEKETVCLESDDVGTENESDDMGTENEANGGEKNLLCSQIHNP
jgi:hypothetical protein